MEGGLLFECGPQELPVLAFEVRLEDDASELENRMLVPEARFFLQNLA